nr:hypothetical protein [Tanacetum cinerariifolium]
MANVGSGATTLRSCLKATKVRNIDGTAIGKDDSIGNLTREDEVITQVTLNPNDIHADAWADPNVSTMQSSEVASSSPLKMSFLDIVAEETNTNKPKVNFRVLMNNERVKNSDCVLPVESVIAAQNKFANSLTVMRDDDDVYYFKFTSKSGLEQVFERGPWLIRNQPLNLTKWSPNMTLSKDKVTKVPVWVKIHKVPVVAYCKDGLSFIATQIGKPIMLDAFTSTIHWKHYGGRLEAGSSATTLRSCLKATKVRNIDGTAIGKD